MSEITIRVGMRGQPLSIDEAVRMVTREGTGAVAIFVGTVRDNNEGHHVSKLEYEAYSTMAMTEMNQIRVEIEAEVPEVQVAALHRTGMLSIGEIAVVCAASAPHRNEAFQACRMMIDRIKERVPVWKREHGPDGPSWIGWVDARASAAQQAQEEDPLLEPTEPD